MRRIIYILVIASACATLTTSCTDEEITPTNTELDNGGGNGTGDPLNPVPGK